MKIGVPRERIDNENRVGMTPAGVEELTKAGHTLMVEEGAGLGSGIDDAEYIKAGATIVTSRTKLYEQSDMIVKVKEPLPDEYDLYHENQILVTYLHLAASSQLASALMDRGVVAVGYETIQLAGGTLPCLIPMSEVAGRMVIQIGAQYLERTRGGRGVLLGGVSGVPPANVVIIGGGTVGTQAAKVALGMGAHVTIVDLSIDRLRYLEDVLHGSFITLVSNRYNIERACINADLLIGAVLVPGGRAPRLVTEDMVEKMKDGAVIVDVAVDQGGCIESIDRATSHSNPTYVKHGVIHYAVPNIPGAVPFTATHALTNATLPYLLTLANHGVQEAARRNDALARGYNVVGKHIVHEEVARALDLPYTPLEEALYK